MIGAEIKMFDFFVISFVTYIVNTGISFIFFRPG